MILFQPPNLYLQSSKGGSKSPPTWPVVRPAAPNGSASARRCGGGHAGGHDSVLWPAPTKPRKNPAQKNTFFYHFFVGRIEEATGSGLERDMFFFEKWFLIWCNDLIHWWLVRDDGWWVMMRRRRLSICLILEVCVQISIEVWFKSNPTLSDSYDELKPFQAQVQIGEKPNQLLPQAHSNHRCDWLAISQTPKMFGLSGAV